jgi:hypothetical protein
MEACHRTEKGPNQNLPLHQCLNLLGLQFRAQLQKKAQLRSLYFGLTSGTHLSVSHLYLLPAFFSSASPRAQILCPERSGSTHVRRKSSTRVRRGGSARTCDSSRSRQIKVARRGRAAPAGGAASAGLAGCLNRAPGRAYRGPGCMSRAPAERIELKPGRRRGPQISPMVLAEFSRVVEELGV